MVKQTNSKKTKKTNDLDKLLEQHKEKFETLQNGKIKCVVTGHEFLPSEQNLVAHLNSKAYKKANEALFDISEYEGVLETHKEGENFLFCRLTGAKIPKKKSAIEKHVNGRRFKVRFEEYKEKVEKEGEEEEEEDEQIDEEEEDVEQEAEEQEEQEEQEQEIEQEEEQEEEEEKPEQTQKQQKPAAKQPQQQNGHSKSNKKNKNNKRKNINKNQKKNGTSNKVHNGSKRNLRK